MLLHIGWHTCPTALVSTLLAQTLVVPTPTVSEVEAVGPSADDIQLCLRTQQTSGPLSSILLTCQTEGQSFLRLILDEQEALAVKAERHSSLRPCRP